MSFATAAAQGVSVATGLMAGQTGAHAARYQGAVDANTALINSENAARSSEARAAADRFNAAVSEQLAESETERAGAEATDFRRAQSARQASSRARLAASGLALEGSPLMVDENIFSEIEFGAARLVHAGQVTATRLRNQATLLRRSADFDTETAINTREAGRKTAQWAVEGGEIRADAARLAGFGNAANSLTAPYRASTLTGRGAGWGLGDM